MGYPFTSITRHGLRTAGFFALSILAACGRSSEPATHATVVAAGGTLAATEQCVLYEQAGPIDQSLINASGAGDVDRVKQLIEKGASVNGSGMLKRTPLFAAAFCDQPSVIGLLMGAGANLDALDIHGMTPLHAAVTSGSMNAVRVLATSGAKIDRQDFAGRTPLHLAAATNDLVLVEALLKFRPNTRLRDKDGLDPPALAQRNGHPDIAAVVRRARTQ